MSVFETLNAINVNGHTEKKGNLTYLSWAWAWSEVKKAFPEATYKVYENAQGWNYHTDGKTAWVKTGVTIEGIEYIEYLPVMDARNRSITLETITSFDVNKTIQRSLTKACARHGLGLYIYAGEDLPESEQTPITKPAVDRDILIKTIVVMASNHNLTDMINAQGYKGKAWDTITDEQLTQIKLWLVDKAKQDEGA